MCCQERTNNIKIEIRADNTAHIDGYVNAVERQSRPVITSHGKCVEIIHEKVFERALENSDNILMTVDHLDKPIADTESGTLKLYEDNIGLRASAVITDAETVQNARNGKIKGWSFGMNNVIDTLEERADSLPLRHITGLQLDHVTLVVNKTPCYSATSVEVRAEKETDIELRGAEATPEVKIDRIDYTEYETKLSKIKGDT